MNFFSKAKYIALSTLTAAFALAAPISHAAKQDGNSTQIVGGSFVPQGSYPWTAALLDSSQRQVCGGSLIAPQWVVTAAHCLDYVESIRVGSIDRDAGGQVANVILKVKHPNYNDVADDIALLKLDHPITTIVPVQLASQTPGAGSPTRLLGWGQITSPFGGDSGSKFLKYLDTTMLQPNQCVGTGAGDLCIYGTPTATSCKGDSGGPALVNNLLVGVTSRSGKPDVTYCGENVIYTSIASYRNWILPYLHPVQITDLTCPGRYQNREQSFSCNLSYAADAPVTATWQFIGNNGVFMDDSVSGAWGYCQPRQYVQFKVTLRNSYGATDTKTINYLCYN